MEQDSGTTAAVAAVSAAAGTFLSLNEHEQRYYSGLHAVCQADGSGKLSSPKVAELFKASQLPPEALHKVTEVCGAKRLGYFGTAQFYVALKLLAAAQSGLPVRLESVAANLPLPRFVGLQTEAEMRYSSAPAGGVEGQVTLGGTGSGVAWTTTEKSAYRHVEPGIEKELWSPPRSPCTSPPRSPSTYRNYPYTRNGAEPHMVYDIHSSRPVEPYSSPSNYGPKPAVDLSTAAAVARAGSTERLDQQEAGYPDDDPWRITEEQLQYYTNQFTSLQPDLNALILGAVAKDFFTKSKLPIPELSHIWELSDVDRDGALTFTEFCTAFHLIVARKNGYPLPESLPPTLRLGFVQPEEDVPDTPESVEPLIVFEDTEVKHSQNLNIVERLQPQIISDPSEEATQQGNSYADATVRIAALEPTPQLGTFPQRPEPPQELDPQMKMKTRPRSYSSTSIEDAMKKAEEPPTPPPRPQKSHSRASSLDLNKLFQQGALGAKSGWLPPPPALPPRPAPLQVPHFAPEKPPQNKLPQPNFADFSHFREEEESSVKVEGQSIRSRFGPSTEDLTGASKQDLLHGAPQKPVRRKYHPEVPNMDVPPSAMTLAPPTKAPQKVLSKQKREIQMAIRKNKETNAVLKRLNSELQQQLKVVHQERVTLESQLELVRPVAST